jgi:hypothetical protein
MPQPTRMHATHTHTGNDNKQANNKDKEPLSRHLAISNHQPTNYQSRMNRHQLLLLPVTKLHKPLGWFKSTRLILQCRYKYALLSCSEVDRAANGCSVVRERERERECVCVCVCVCEDVCYPKPNPAVSRMAQSKRVRSSSSVSYSGRSN